MLELLTMYLSFYKQYRGTHSERLDEKIDRLVEELKWMD